jgi:uncharacterized protein
LSQQHHPERNPDNLEAARVMVLLNVAISRAQCLAIVVASPDLLTVKCNTVEQMALVNLLCWVAGEAE